ncbi:MAG: YqaE/Pmp3 family membrane protein [Gemmataceae bacterium]
MRYVIAILLPPLGMLFCGRIFQAIVCLILMCTLIGWPVASIWAALVVSNYYTEKSNKNLIQEIRHEHG